MLQTEPRRGAAEGRDEPCLACERVVRRDGEIIACVHVDGLGVILLWDDRPSSFHEFGVCGPGQHPAAAGGPGCRAVFFDDLPAAEAEFERRAALLGRAE